MIKTYDSPELAGAQQLVSSRVPPEVVDLLDDLALRTKRNRAAVIRTIVLRHFVNANALKLSDPRDTRL